MAVTEIGAEEFACVFLGKDLQPVPEFSNHPNVQWIRAESGQDLVQVIKTIPAKAKIFLLTEGIPHAIYHPILAESRRRQLPYLSRKNAHAVRGTLRELFPTSEEQAHASSNGDEPKKMAERGAIKRFLDSIDIDYTKSTAEESRRLIVIAKAQGITTTTASLAQAISKKRREEGRGDIPASARPKDVKGDGIALLNDTIAQLELLREWIQATDDENKALRRNQEAIRIALGANQ